MYETASKTEIIPATRKDSRGNGGYTVTVTLWTTSPANVGFQPVLNSRFNIISQQLRAMGVQQIRRGNDQFGIPMNRMNGFPNMTIFTIQSTTTTNTIIRTSCIVPCP